MAARKSSGMTARVASRMANLPYGGVGMAGASPVSMGAMSGIGNRASPPKPAAGGAYTQINPAVLPKPAAPAAPAAPGAAPATPGAASGDPMAKYKDSSYFSAIAQNIAKRTGGLAGLQESDSRLKADNATALQRLARNYAGQRQNLTEGANKSGLFYSGILGKRLGDAETNYTDQRGDINNTMSRQLIDNEAQRKGLLEQYGNPADASDYGLAGGDQLAAAGQRYQQQNPVPPTVLGRPGENGLPQGFNTGGWQGLGAGYTIEWDTATGKAKRIVKQ